MDSEPDDAHSTYTVDAATLIARRLVRFILSVTESKNTIISKGRLQKKAKEISNEEGCAVLPLARIIDETNKILGDVYGYRLEGLPPKVVNQASDQVARQEQSAGKAQRYILLNKMQTIDEFEDLIFSQNVLNYEEMINDGEYSGRQLASDSSDTLNSKLHLDQDLAFKGLLCVILCVIMFSKNHILQQELLDHLTTFGVPIDGTKIPLVNMPILELLKTLDRLEYIARFEEPSEMDLETITYRVGRRTQAEFPLDSLVQLTSEVMGIPEEQSPKLKEDIRQNIADSYNLNR